MYCPVANKKQVAKLLESAERWNVWRTENPDDIVDLGGADLVGRNLQRANLIGADLIGADLHGADLTRVALVGAFLIGANLTRADLALADLRWADLRGARLLGADLRQSLFVTQAQLSSARGDATTKLSSALYRPSHWIS